MREDSFKLWSVIRIPGTCQLLTYVTGLLLLSLSFRVSSLLLQNYSDMIIQFLSFILLFRKAHPEEGSVHAPEFPINLVNLDT